MMWEDTSQEPYFTFTNPPDWNSANEATSRVFVTESRANLSWQTNMDNYSILLGPRFQVPELPRIYTKLSGKPEAGGFPWNISTVNLDSSVLAMGNFILGLTYADPVGLSPTTLGQSQFFNISDANIHEVSSQSIQPTQPTTTGAGALRSSVRTPIWTTVIGFSNSNTVSECCQVTTTVSGFPLSSTTTVSTASNSPSTSMVPMTSNSPLPTTSNSPLSSSSMLPTTSDSPSSLSFESAAVSNSSSDKTTLYTGLGVGLGMLFIILCLLGLGIRIFLKRRHYPNTENSKSRNAPATPSERNSSLTSTFNPPFRAELPTPFNAVRSMKATFLAKFELPGKDNELPNPAGPFELAVD